MISARLTDDGGRFSYRYQYNTYRKNTLLRVRKFLNESTVDRIPILVELQVHVEISSRRSHLEITGGCLFKSLGEMDTTPRRG